MNTARVASLFNTAKVHWGSDLSQLVHLPGAPEDIREGPLSRELRREAIAAMQVDYEDFARVAPLIVDVLAKAEKLVPDYGAAAAKFRRALGKIGDA